MLFLGGGGGSEESEPIESRFFSTLRTHSKILYIPVGLRGIRPLSSCVSWFEQSCAKFGDFTVKPLVRFNDPVGDFDAVYIGGGNTYRLSYELGCSNFAQQLTDFEENGLPVFGGSAGAVILGRSISTVADIDTNTVGLRNMSGLDLLRSYSVWVHYKIEQAASATSLGIPVIALPEDSGVVMGDRIKGLEAIGDVHYFNPPDCNGFL